MNRKFPKYKCECGAKKNSKKADCKACADKPKPAPAPKKKAAKKAE